jgi:biopolymer transport protein ExbD
MFKSSLRKRPQINIIPMIDVIFFLLVFFMLFTTFKTSPYGVDIKLPKAMNVAKTQSVNVVVHITGDGRLYVKDEPVTLQELQSKVKDQLAKKPDATVVLKADESAQYKSLIQVMDAVSQVGGFNFALAADKVEKTGNE